MVSVQICQKQHTRHSNQIERTVSIAFSMQSTFDWRRWVLQEPVLIAEQLIVMFQLDIAGNRAILSVFGRSWSLRHGG